MTEVGGALRGSQRNGTNNPKHNIPQYFQTQLFMQIQQLIKKGGILILTLLILTSTATAQDLLKGNNLANVRVDQLSDGDIAKLKSQLSAQGMTIDQAEPIAIAKGRTHCVGEGLKKSSPKKVIQIKKDVKGDRQSFILVKLLMILYPL